MGSPVPSNGVRKLDELPFQAELRGEALREGLDTELLGRVVPRGDEVDPELAREVEARLGRLAGEVEVVAGGRRVRQVALPAAGDDRDPLELGRAFGEDERLASGPVADTRHEVVAAR